MPTTTSQRISVTVRFSEPLAKALDQEVAFTDSNHSVTIRRIIKWHQGKSAERHPNAPPVKLSKRCSDSKVTKPIMFDPDDVTYLDKLATWAGVPRVTVIIMIIFQYFDIDPFPKVVPK